MTPKKILEKVLKTAKMKYGCRRYTFKVGYCRYYISSLIMMAIRMARRK